MTSSDLAKREGAENVSMDILREGERIAIQYRSAQSDNVVIREGEITEATRIGTRTRNVFMLAENGTEYKIDRHSYIRSTGSSDRRLSKGMAEVYRLEKLDIESWHDEIICGGLHIDRKQDEVFDCPWCGEKNKASVNNINDDGSVTVSCGHCREKKTLPDQPVMISLAVVR